MQARQGDAALLQDPLAQELLQAKVPARLAYNGADGTSHVISIGFHWNGQEVVVCTTPDSPKMQALRNGVKVALSIDITDSATRALLIRGSIRINEVWGMAPEYAAMTRRVMGERQGQDWLDHMKGRWPRTARILIRPEWVGLLDLDAHSPDPPPSVHRTVRRS